jgi:hypothetical protein
MHTTAKTNFFLIINFLMQLIGGNIDFGLSWDKGSWFTLEYKFNFGTPTQVIKLTTQFFSNLNLDIYTTNSTRINFGLDSSRTETSKVVLLIKIHFFNMSFHYKPSKK